MLQVFAAAHFGTMELITIRCGATVGVAEAVKGMTVAQPCQPLDARDTLDIR
jgi:hypothetical protein